MLQSLLEHSVPTNLRAKPAARMVNQILEELLVNLLAQNHQYETLELPAVNKKRTK
jgi:hypothetical protein